MGIDAVAVLRPKNAGKIRDHIDPTGPGTLLVPLEDGTLLFHSFMRFEQVEQEPHEIRQWLEQTFADDLPLVHDDTRGVLVFPDICEPRAQTYQQLVAEVETAGFWVPLDDGADAAHHAAAAHARRAAAHEAFTASAASFGERVRDLLSGSVDPASPEALAMLGELMNGPGALVRQPPADMALRCVIVQRRTPLAVPADEVNETFELPDRSAVVYTVDLGTLDDLSWRLASCYGHWTAEHTDPRGVPAFDGAHRSLARDARSYAHALELLGDLVTFVRPKGIDEREAERKAKLDAALGPRTTKRTKKRTAKSQTAKTKPKPAKTRTRPAKTKTKAASTKTKSRARR